MDVLPDLPPTPPQMPGLCPRRSRVTNHLVHDAVIEPATNTSPDGISQRLSSQLLPGGMRRIGAAVNRSSEYSPAPLAMQAMVGLIIQLPIATQDTEEEYVRV